MVKKRVHELAKELNIESKEIVNKLSQMGIAVKSHMSTLEDSEVKSLLKFYKKDMADSRPVEAPAITTGEKTDKKAADKTETNAAQARGRATGPAARTNQDRQGEKKREMGITDQRKPEKGKGYHGEQRREGSLARGDQFRGADRGPGMVDRVPSRPPDRRFQERPKQADKPAKPWGQPKPEQIKPPRQAETMTEHLQQDQNKQDISTDRQPERPIQGDGNVQRTDRLDKVSIRTDEKQRFPENDKDRLATEVRTPRAGDRNYRQGGPQGQRPGGTQGQRLGGQHSPRPDGPQSQRPYAPHGQRPYGTQGQRPGGPQGQRPGGPQGQRTAGPQGQRPGGPQGQRPGGPQGQRTAGPQGQRPGGPQGARPKPYDRPATGNTGQTAWPKLDNPAPRPQVFQDDRGRAAGEKNKTGEKPKTAPKTDGQHRKPPVRGRSDKRNAIADLAEERLRAGGLKKKGNFKQQEQRLAQPLEKKPVVLGEHTTVQELALKLYKRPAELIKKLMQLGVLTTINQEIDIDTATILAEEFGFEVEIKLPVDIEAVLMQEPEEDPELSQYRPCVVTVMGHVDHGKTSLLDAIRETNVTATEAGGITQHIGAYQVEHNGKRITFVDTPGHEAFTAMRARGAQVTDIAILVVAADDGVMPQTIEALNHAKEAKVPIIVAINKIDKPGANPDRVKQQLTEHGLVAEEWGGETIFVNVSALKREGLNELLEMILLVAEIGELKANPNKPARGTVIEAQLDKGRGPVATVLVQSGSLNIGDTIIAGSVFGRVRAMMDDKGKRTKKAGPSTPVEVLGLSEVPKAGDVFIVVEDEKLARTIVARRQTKRREEELKTTTRISLEDLFKHIQEGQIKELGIIVKADVQGSVEALRQALERLNTGEVKVNIIHSGVGAIREHDIMLASASNAIIIGFNVRPDINARKAAENERVDVRLYRVIYDAIEDVRAAMSGLLDPEYREVMLGRAEIRKIFRASRIGTIAGCYVLEGKIERDAGVRVVRDGIVVHEGKLDSLKRFKDDVKEVVQGYECGLALEKYNEIQEGDIIEAFTTETVKRELS